MSSEPNQKEQIFSREALLPTPPWAQAFIHTCSWGQSKPPDIPSSTPRSCFRRGDSEGGGGKPLLAAPSLLASQVTVPGLWRCSCGRRLETGKQYPAQMASRCSPLHLLACHSPLKPQALLCLCLGPRETGGQRILNPRPLRFLHPHSPVCSPRHT